MIRPNKDMPMILPSIEYIWQRRDSAWFLMSLILCISSLFYSEGMNGWGKSRIQIDNDVESLLLLT